MPSLIGAWRTVLGFGAAVSLAILVGCTPTTNTPAPTTVVPSTAAPTKFTPVLSGVSVREVVDLATSTLGTPPIARIVAVPEADSYVCDEGTKNATSVPGTFGVITVCNDRTLVVTEAVADKLANVPHVAVWFEFASLLAVNVNGFLTRWEHACVGGYVAALNPQFDDGQQPQLLQYIEGAGPDYAQQANKGMNLARRGKPLSDCDIGG